MIRPKRPAKSRAPRVEQTRKLAFEALEKRELLSVSYFDAASGATLSHQDTISLTSYAADASGQAQAPAYGETAYTRVTLKNTSDAPIDVTSAALSSGSRVELVGDFSQNLEPNEETSFILKWQALAPETSTVASNPRKAFYGQEVTRATNMKSLRDQYYSVAGEAIRDYYASITSAYTDYVSGALTALTAAERAYFSALKSYSNAAMNADEDYSLVLFTAERARAEEYFGAAITEITAKEAELAASRASAYATQLNAITTLFNGTQFSEGRGGYDAVVDTMTQSEQTAYFGEIVSVSNQITSTKSNADSADSALAVQNESTLASYKT